MLESVRKVWQRDATPESCNGPMSGPFSPIPGRHSSLTPSPPSQRAPASVVHALPPSLEFRDRRRTISDRPFLSVVRSPSPPLSPSGRFSLCLSLPALHICSFVTSFRSEYEPEECRSGGESSGSRSGHARMRPGGRRVAGSRGDGGCPRMPGGKARECWHWS